MLTLDKRTGRVTCDLPGLATLAQEHLDRAIEARTGSDVTRVIQKLFERHADLFAIRPQGAGEFEDLKERLRLALAGEMAKHVATAIGDVIRAVFSGERIPLVRRSEFDRRAEDDDPWAEGEDPYDPDRSPYYVEPDEDEPSTTPLPAVNASVAVAASLFVARWWMLARRGTLLGALGAGMGVGILGLVGGPVARTVLVILAATGDLLSVSDAIGNTASRLKQA